MKNIVDCKYCDAGIRQLAVNVWINKHGCVFCPNPNAENERILHEPVIDEEWRLRIKRLHDGNPHFWTVRELAQIMLLTPAQIEQALEA